MGNTHPTKMRIIMLDPKYLRTHIDEVAQKLATRGYTLDVSRFTSLEEKRKKLQTEVEEFRNQRNLSAKEVGQAKATGKPIDAILAKVSDLGDKLKHAEDELTTVQNDLEALYLDMPNIPHESVPIGKDEKDNVELRRVGTPREFDFTPRDHVELGQLNKGIDFEAASNLSGARFVVLRGAFATLQRALIQFMLDLHTNQHGYQEMYVPYLVHKEMFYGTGQLPKFADDLFFAGTDDAWGLIPTAEVPLTNLARDKVFAENELPLRFVAHTPCFRAEAGSYGKDTRGMIRQHQFEKVELVQFTTPENSYQMHEELTAHAEQVLQLLGLPYRVMALCTGDIGNGSAKTYDLEVWLPGQQTYREISSCSNFESFQARRMQARFRSNETGKPELIHTLNGSGVAAGRALVAMIENYQTKEGNILIPEILHRYTNGLHQITVQC